MIAGSHEFSELQDLLELLCEDRANRQQLARLQELAQASPAAMQFYVDYLDQHARLLWRFRRFAADVFNERTADVSACAADEGVPSNSSGVPAICIGDAVSNAGLTAPCDDSVGGLTPGAILPSWLSPLSMLSLLAVATATAVGFFLLLSRPTPGEPAPAQLAHGRINSVQLESGITTLSLDKIGTVIVEGPSDFELVGPMRARLTRGRIRMHVTEPTGRGFVVETPNGEVTDLGTEFGIDVSGKSGTGVVVFQGSVDLAVAASAEGPSQARMERLVQGEGMTINGAGQLGRIMSIVTGGVATFQPSYKMPTDMSGRVIAQVADNFRAADLKNFYEIVPGGLKEDALAYADRPHEWNGIDGRGIPSYLIGADYVKTFNNDKMRQDVEIAVTLCRPAKLFVFFDVRVSPPDWLRHDFRDTGEMLGLDNARFFDPYNKVWFDGYARGVGPGNSIDDQFSIWERVVKNPGVIKLGANAGESWYTGMYAIAAVRLEQHALRQERTSNVGRGPIAQRTESDSSTHVDRGGTFDTKWAFFPFLVRSEPCK